MDLISAAGRVRISHKGAQVLDARFGDRPMLWLTPRAAAQEAERGAAVRGGVPVCFPWFGRRAGRPAHGFARNREWSVIAAGEDRAVLALDDDGATRELWPHRFHAEMAITVDDGLHFEFAVMNTDTGPFEFTYALHSYFAVDASTARVDGVASFAEPIDKIVENAPAQLVLRDTDREILIETQGMPSAVVWNPGPNDTPDIGDGWRDFACVERGRVGAAAVSLEVGQTHRSSMRLLPC